MYCDFFGLRASPFEDRADARLYCPTPDHEEAIAALEYAAHYGKGLSLLLGAAGTGKTMIARALTQRLHATDHAVVLTVPTGQTVNLVRDVAKGFGVTLPSHPSSSKCLARLRRVLIQKLEANHRSILILDQVENLTDEDLRKVAALTELQQADRKLLEMIFVGQPQFVKLLGLPEFSRMRQQAFGERVLRPLTADETANYVSRRLTLCGAGEDAFFDDAALRAVFDASAGNCRLINQICNAAMVAAYGANRKRIDAAVIAEVVHSEIDSTGAGARGGTDSDRSFGRGERPPTSPIAPDRGKTLHAASAPASLVRRPTRLDEDDHGSSPQTEPAEVGAPRERAASARHRGPRSDRARGSSAVSAAGEAERVERLLRRVERSRAMQEASLAQYSTLEAQLEELAGTEDRISANMDVSLSRADDRVEEVEQRCQAVLGETEARVAVLEERARKAEQMAAGAERRLAEVNDAAQRGEEVEQRLNAFARELGDRVDQAQERVGLLMTGLDAGHDAHHRLESMADQVHQLAEQVEHRVKTERVRLEEAVARAERCQSALCEEAVAAHRAAVLEAIKVADRADIESAKAELARYRDQLGELVKGSRTELAAVGESIKARHKEMEVAVSTCTEALAGLHSASRAKAASLNREWDEIESRHESVAKMVSGLGSEARRIGADANELSNQLRSEREAVDGRVAECRRAAEEVERVTAEAERTRSALAATVEEQAARIGSHHAAATSLVRLLAEGTKAGHECQDTLGRSCKTGKELIEQLDRARSTTHEEARSLEEPLRDAIQQGRSQLDEAKVVQGRIESVQRAVEGSLMHVGSACERAAELEAQVTRCQKNLELIGEKEGAVAALVELANQAQAAIENATREARRFQEQLAGAVEKSSVVLAEARETHVQLGSRHAAARSVLHQLTEVDERSRGALNQVEESCDRARASVEAAERVEKQIETRSAEARDTEGHLASTIKQGMALLHETKTAQERMETVHRTVAAGLLDTGAALERASALRGQMEDCQRIVETLEQARERGDGLATNLSHMVADGHMVHDALAQILRESDHRTEALGASTGRAAELVERLGGAEESAAATAKKLEQSTALAGERATAVERVNLQSRETVERAEARIKTLSALREQVAEVIESANQKARETQAASERLERLTEDVWSLSGTSEARAKDLVAEQGEAAALLKQITTATGSIEKIAGPLSELVRLAEQHRGGLEKGCTGAAELVDRLKAVPALMASVKQSHTDLEATAGRADELRLGLTKLTEQADRHVVAMRNLGEASEIAERLTAQRTEAAEVLERLEETRTECKDLAGQIVEQAGRIVERVDRADRLTQRIESQEVRLETGAKSIAGLAKQVQAVASRLTELQAQSSRIDESISRVTAKPQEIIAAAKDQAVHLESVCSAVRKVFAGLSKTTIESKKHKDAFEAVSHEAGTRLTQLKTETDRAARTLHQWVEEASRAQARLAETLGQVPSIAETHGADALTRLAGAAFAGPIKSMPAEEGLRMGSPSQGVDTVTGMFDDTDGNDAADEVARMIEEAKRAPVAGRS